jgi:hypothetical protein
MKALYFILGIVLLVFGVAMTSYTWYNAAYKNDISEASAYAGPVLVILGALRIVRAAAAVPLPSVARIAVVGIAILCGYGNSAAIKAAFPQAHLESSTTSN